MGKEGNVNVPVVERTYKNFEEEINGQFDLQPTEATIRESKRSGIMGYKIGCTHFWDKWGCLVPCTVL